MQLPNIGPTIEGLLTRVGLDTPEKLRDAGIKEAFRRVKAVEPNACHSKRYAIAGAIRGVRWHELSTEEKDEINILFLEV